MTPLQKSIAEIEALHAVYDGMDNARTVVSHVLDILTANLEYERGVIKDAYKAGIENEYGYCQRLIEQHSEYPCARQCNHCKTYYAPLEEQLISDYYTKTYENGK